MTSLVSASADDAGNETLTSSRMRERARLISNAGGINRAIECGALADNVEVTLSEALVLALLKQGVTRYFAIFGHGSTDLGEALRIYDEEGLTRTLNFRNEVAMAHAATAYSWQYGRVPAVVTSIGPGGLQAMAGSLAAASNGVGVYHIYGDETTHGEGYNMQQIPKRRQGLYGQLTEIMGESYVLHTPQALRDAMRRGTLRVHHPHKAGPFYLLLPLNTQPESFSLRLSALPDALRLPRVGVADRDVLAEAAGLVWNYNRIAIKAGGGTRGHDDAVCRLAETIGATVVQSPGSTGVLPDDHPQNMHVGGSKGSISGNYAMENAELVIVIGSRAVCQADCSGIGYKQARAVININADLGDLTHYNRTVPLAGDIDVVVDQLLAVLEDNGGVDLTPKRPWLEACREKKDEWARFKRERFEAAPIKDPVWGADVLTEPAAIKAVADFARSVGAVKYFDAGDVQANGFQIVEDDSTGETFTESGASYMGFAVSAISAAAAADRPAYGIAFTGDGSFMMNPQVLIDAVEHGVRGMVVIFDNRRMAAITGLQKAQYGNEFRTDDGVAVDYVQLAGAVQGVHAVYGGGSRESLEKALSEAYSHSGLSVVHVPVYHGDDPISEMGAYGSWNVGNWCEAVQDAYHHQDI